MIETRAISPDGQWLVVYARDNQEEHGGTLAFPLAGGPPERIWEGSPTATWSPDGKLLFLPSGLNTRLDRTYAIPLRSHRAWPDTPVKGLSEEQVASIPGVRIIDSWDVAPGPAPEIYAFARQTVQRNLYRIPLR